MTGLVLEGGAMRGMFTCGVLDVFMENDVTFDAMVGVSAGASFGCNFKSKQIGRAIRYNKKYCDDKRFASIGNLLREGNIFGADFCYNRIPFELDVFDTDTFKNNPMDFYCVCTDVETGRPYYHKCSDGLGTDLKMIQASASMPVVSKIVNINGKKYLDGGVSDSVPVRFFEKIGFERIVVILTQPVNYVKKPNRMVPLIKLMYSKYPNLVAAMKNRHEMYNECTEHVLELEREGRIFVIRPDEPLGIPHIVKNDAELERVYQIGRKMGESRLGLVRKYLT